MTKKSNMKPSRGRKVVRVKNLLSSKSVSVTDSLDTSAALETVPVSYDEVLTDYHNQAKTEIELLRQQALADLEQLRKDQLQGVEDEVQAKLQQGYDVGYSKGYEEGEAKLSSLADDFLKMLNQAVEEKNIILNAAGQELLDLSFKIAEKIIQTQLNQNSSIFKNILEEAISQVTQKDKVLVKVSTSDFETIQQYRTDLETKFKDIKQLDIISDPEIASGGCIIETKLGYIDSSISTKKELIQRAFMALYDEIDHPDKALATSVEEIGEVSPDEGASDADLSLSDLPVDQGETDEDDTLVEADNDEEFIEEDASDEDLSLSDLAVDQDDTDEDDILVEDNNDNNDNNDDNDDNDEDDDLDLLNKDINLDDLDDLALDDEFNIS